MNGILAREQRIQELERENAELRTVMAALLSSASGGVWKNVGEGRSLLRPLVADCRRAEALLAKGGQS